MTGQLSIQQVREIWHQSLTDKGSLNIITFTFKLNEVLLDKAEQSHPELGSGALREALRQATETLRVYTAMIPDQRIELEIKQYDALLSLPSPIEPFPSWICNNCGRLEPGGMGKPIICGSCGWNNWKQDDSATLRPTSQASSEIREARVAAFNEAIDAINGVRFAFERSGWADALERVIKLRTAALAPSRQGAGGK